MDKPILLTSALPYANGPLHMGHMVEYIQTDIYSRFLKLIGKKSIYVCADDTHGTPIEVNATKQGKTPEEFIKHWFMKHTEEMKAYGIEHDSYYTTNSKENQHFTNLLFGRLKEKGLIYTKEIELMYCENDKRFLPDRYVKGICPKCGAKDQYGDNCEKCGATYTPVDLIESYCSICKEKPVRKMSEHYFFKLSSFSEKLKTYLSGNDRLQPEIKKQILNWIKEGLEDWCISRDAPYFGFKIPGEENKYFYVWLDAPVGYLASTANYFESVEKAEQCWNDSEVVHFIGKDIIYFHLLFWPAVLMGAGFKPADNVVVHGFLNINGEKMSKSRGTFFTAEDFRKISNTEFLRYYFAANLTHSMTDIDLNIDDFKARINNELVANIANFAYRTLSFTNKSFGSKLGKIRNSMILEEVKRKAELAKTAYLELDYRKALSAVLEISSIGNKYFQDNAPWAMIKENKDETLMVMTDCVNILKDLMIVLKPIMPNFVSEIETQLGLEALAWKDLDMKIENHEIRTAKIIIQKIEKIELSLPDKKEETEKEEGEAFAKLNLKVAKVIGVSEHYKADKLLLINIDLGKGETRQLVAGLRPFYEDPQVLVGKHIICVTNLEHANLRGEMSQGMLLAAETEDVKTVMVVEAPDSEPGSQVFIEGIEIGKETIKFDDFMKTGIYVHDSKIMYKGKQLQTDSEKISSKIKSGKVR
ncbi:MAG: methionine--tRNA ligase [Candidatus Woesearchaeota archaeon]|nr:methionine--tRNA ligase [Candidatus Woesearchaeota archaeon]